MSLVLERPSELPVGLANEIWKQKYRLHDADGTAVDFDVEDTFRRVATAVSIAEAPSARRVWAARFADQIQAGTFVPGGRILAGAGSGRNVTLFNCFVMGRVPDNMDGIFTALKEAALTLQMGGGIGVDFSSLRPAGAPVTGVGADASGPVSFMGVWDAMCRTIMAAGARRGAMMATLQCDHPDIETFIEAKQTEGELSNFNLSVLVTDAFMQAVETNEPWPLQFEGEVWRTVSASALWQRLMRATYDAAEPGVIFIDRVNKTNNLANVETISATNPCGEQPLPPYGACLLGAINLAALVRRPFQESATIDPDELAATVAVGVRFLDNVIDVSNYPLPAQEQEAKSKRRIGLGVTGLANALIYCGQHYGQAAGRALAARWVSQIKEAAYDASAKLAAERGAFPLWSESQMSSRPNLINLSAATRSQVERHGLRNATLTTIAPTGTTSLFAGNVSSGIEPVFALQYARRMRQRDGSIRMEQVEDAAVRTFRQMFGRNVVLPETFVTASDLTPAQHIQMQAALQPHVDSAISKTVNCPREISFDAFKDVYAHAYRSGLKGCTTFRPNAIRGSVLVAMDERPSDGSDASGASVTDATGLSGNATPEVCEACGTAAISVEEGCRLCRACGVGTCAI